MSLTKLRHGGSEPKARGKGTLRAASVAQPAWPLTSATHCTWTQTRTDTHSLPSSAGSGGYPLACSELTLPSGCAQICLSPVPAREALDWGRLSRGPPAPGRYAREKALGRSPPCWCRPPAASLSSFGAGGLTAEWAAVGLAGWLGCRPQPGQASAQSPGEARGSARSPGPGGESRAAGHRDPAQH